MHNYPVQAGVLRALKPVISTMVSEVKNKKNTYDDLLVFLLYNIDRKLDLTMSLEIFQALMDIIVFSFNFTDNKNFSNFGMFADVITKRYPYLSEKIRTEIIKATSDYQFCELLAERDSFPAWLIDSYNEHPESIDIIAVKLFSFSICKTLVQKFRVFLIGISRKNINIPLTFYKKVLETLILEKLLIEPCVFIDFSSILEDILNPDLAGRTEIVSDLYYDILESLIKQATSLDLLHCTYPALPHIDYSLLYDLFKQNPLDLNISDQIIYLREGGFLRLILKFIFIGLTKNPFCVNLLKTVIKSGPDTSSLFQLNHSSKQAADKRMSEFLIEKYSVSYLKFPSKDEDSFFSEKFLSFYILTELTEVLNTSACQTLVDFTLLFIQDTNIDKWLVA